MAARLIRIGIGTESLWIVEASAGYRQTILVLASSATEAIAQAETAFAKDKRPLGLILSVEHVAYDGLVLPENAEQG
jgi:hypothetical protein